MLRSLVHSPPAFRFRPAVFGLVLAGGLLELAAPRAAEPGASTNAGPPRIAFHYPAGGQVGTRFDLEVSGDWPQWPIQGRSFTSGILLAPTETEGRFQVSLAPDVPPGPALLWFYNEQGAAAPRQFVVGANPELTETATRSAADGLPVPQAPIALNGRLLTREEIDTWLLPVTQPLHLEARLLARQLDSPLIARLALLGNQPQPLAATNGTAVTDPTLRAELSVPGLYTLQVSAVTNAGPDVFGSAAIYRLELTTELIEAPPPGEPGRPPLSEGILRPLISRRMLTPPRTVQSFINPYGDVDVYGIESRALERYPFQLRTFSEPPFVARLKIVAPDGETVAEETGTEIAFDWVAPETGRYRIEISAADGGGDPRYGYQLSVGATEPQFEATVATNRICLRPGDTVTFPLQLLRPPGNESALTVSADGLPPGVQVDAALLMPSMTRATVRLTANPEAAPTITAFRLNLLPLTGVLPTAISVTGVVQGRHAPLGALLINETPDFWLTVPPPAAR